MKKGPNTEQFDELLGSELDLDQAWAEFNKEPKKTRRFPIWWCFGIGSIFLLGGLIYLVSNFSSYKDSKDSITTVEEAEVNIPEEPIISFPSEQELIVPKEQISSSIIHQAKTSQTILSKITNRQEGKLSKTQRITENATSIFKESDTDLSVTTSMEIVQNYSSEKLTKSASHLKEKDTDLSVIISKEVVQFTKPKSILKEGDTDLSVITSKELAQNYSSEKALQKETTLEAVAAIAPLLHFLPSQGVREIPTATVQIPKRKYNKWSLGLHYSLGNANRKLSKGQVAYTQRRQKEQFLEANRLELVLSKNWTKFFFLQTGISLSQYRSKLVEEIQTINSPVFYENVVTETHTRNNLTEELIGIAQGSQLVINRYTRFQRYQTLSIPLRLGLRFPLWEQWQITASSGIAVSIFGQTKGLTFSSVLPDGIYVPIEELDYRKTGLIEGMGQLAIERSFGKTSLSLGLQSTFDLNNRFSNKDAGMDKFQNYGIYVGLRRTF